MKQRLQPGQLFKAPSGEVLQFYPPNYRGQRNGQYRSYDGRTPLPQPVQVPSYAQAVWHVVTHDALAIVLLAVGAVGVADDATVVGIADDVVTLPAGAIGVLRLLFIITIKARKYRRSFK